MNEVSKNHPKKSSSWIVAGVISFAAIITVTAWFLSLPEVTNDSPSLPTFSLTDFSKEESHLPPTLFASAYPVSEAFQLELKQLLETKRLSYENESLIKSSVAAAAKEFEAPEALLWCLLFQESRLDHLAGVEESKESTGLGQFSYFSFYEINNQLERYQKSGKEHFIRLLGSDIRPIEAKKSKLFNASSYYNIPTAVTSTAAYLKNRYIHLSRILNKHGYLTDPELVWILSAMAYNKGTRSIVSLWNQLRRTRGRDSFQKALLASPNFFKTFEDQRLLNAGLKRVWPDHDAIPYAKELKIHLKNLRRCATQPPMEETP